MKLIPSLLGISLLACVALVGCMKPVEAPAIVNDADYLPAREPAAESDPTPSSTASTFSKASTARSARYPKEIELLIFSAAWCDVCTEIPPVVFELKQQFPNLKVRELDLDDPENLKLMNEMGGDAVPYMFVLADGEVKSKIKGLLSYPQLASHVKAAGAR